MLKKISIDDNFIKEWEQRYDEPEIGGDYAEYESIIKEVANEVTKGTLTKSTFIRILDWKAPRVKGIIRLDRFYDYQEGIRKALEAPENRKLSILDELYGINVPIASTILHFIYPSNFPIMDVRVAEALYFLGYLNAKSRTQNNYINFRQVVMNIAHESKCSLREVDRALFAYHKIYLEPANDNTFCLIRRENKNTKFFQQQDILKTPFFPFDRAFRILQLKGPALITSSRGTEYVVKAWIMRNGKPAILASPKSGCIYIHDDCWGKNITCQGTRAGGIYNGENNIYSWLENHQTIID